jgi:osmotically-inducible protein OsmY
MKMKFLTILSLAAVLFLVGCGGNKDNTNANANKVAVSTPTPVVKTNETAAVDNTLKTKIEDALKKKGFSDVTIDTTTTPATLRGTVPKGKLAEAVQTAQEAGGKPVKNEVTEK